MSYIKDFFIYLSSDAFWHRLGSIAIWTNTILGGLTWVAAIIVSGDLLNPFFGYFIGFFNALCLMKLNQKLRKRLRDNGLSDKL